MQSNENFPKSLRFFDKTRRCIYIEYPLHSNVGDLLINCGSEQFFEEQGIDIWKRYNYYDFPAKILGIRKDDVLLLNGGGNLGDIWYNFQSFRESILERYPHNRVIFLPQTVHFRSQERETASIRKMAAHHNLHVFVRDYKSFERLQRGGLRCVSPCPDMAHALTEVLKPSRARNAKCRPLFIRHDQESSQMPPELLGREKPTIDWDKGAFLCLSQAPSSPCHKYRQSSREVWPSCRFTSFMVLASRQIDWRFRRPFSRYETIVTNRLHGMLLGILLGRDVIAWDNSYGKLSAYYDAWLHDLPGVIFHRTSTGINEPTYGQLAAGD